MNYNSKKLTSHPDKRLCLFTFRDRKKMADQHTPSYSALRIRTKRCRYVGNIDNDVKITVGIGTTAFQNYHSPTTNRRL